MKVAVVYESMFGNTRQVAEAIRDGLATTVHTELWNAGDEASHDLTGIGLVVLGGPTHAWSMSRPRTRQAAADQAADSARSLTLEPGASGPGIREWIATTRLTGVPVAVFDTRMALPALFTGSAAKAASRAAHQRGARFATRRRSFLVTKQNRLVDGQLDLAREWGEELACSLERAELVP